MHLNYLKINNMKKNLLLFTAAALVAGGLASCENKQNSTLNYSLEAAPAVLDFGMKNNAPRTITVTAENVAWDIRMLDESATWLHLEKKDGSVEVSVDDNPGPEEREAKFLITSDTDKADAIEITVNQIDLTVFLTAYGEHKGDDIEPGVDRFVLTFDSVEYDPETYMPISDGYVLIVDFFSETPSDLFYPDIAPGIYTIGETNAPFNARMWNTYMMAIENGGMTGYLSSESGQFTVERSGEEYTFVFDIMTRDDFYQTEYRLRGSYTGEIPVKNKYLTNLENDFTLPTLVGGYATFWGEMYWGVPVNAWDVYLWSDGMYSDEYNYLYGTGHHLKLELFTSLEGSTAILPDGTYPLLLSQEPGTAHAGHADLFILGCWYLEMKDDMVLAEGLKYAPLSSGDITLSYSGGNYTITVDAVDDLNHRIAASYTGPLAYLSQAYNGYSAAPAKHRNYTPGEKGLKYGMGEMLER